MIALRTAACCAGLTLALSLAIIEQAHASTPKPHRLAPPVHCTMANRLDIFVDEDQILWACECEALSSGFICRWQVIGGVDAVKRAKRKHLKPKRAIAFTIPAVVA